MRRALRIVIPVVVLVAAIGGTFLALGEDSDSASGKPANGIWETGDTWTVKVKKNTGDVAPTEEQAVDYTAVYRFRVAKRSGQNWTVKVKLDGAEGPFADGFQLVYRYGASKMVLTKVGIGDKLAGAEHAPIALGQDFPLETTYDAPPKSHTRKAGEGPTDLPPGVPGMDGAGDSGGVPPKGIPAGPQ